MFQPHILYFYMPHISVLLCLLFFLPLASFSQEEYDDLYFTKKDRKAIKNKNERELFGIKEDAEDKSYESNQINNQAFENTEFINDENQYFHWVSDDIIDTSFQNEQYISFIDS